MCSPSRSPLPPPLHPLPLGFPSAPGLRACKDLLSNPVKLMSFLKTDSSISVVLVLSSLFPLPGVLSSSFLHSSVISLAVLELSYILSFVYCMFSGKNIEVSDQDILYISYQKANYYFALFPVWHHILFSLGRCSCLIVCSSL